MILGLFYFNEKLDIYHGEWYYMTVVKRDKQREEGVESGFDTGLAAGRSIAWCSYTEEEDYC